MKGKVYAQIYSILRTNQEDLVKALTRYSEIGYDGVEILGFQNAGISVKEYKKLLDELNLHAISSHGVQGDEDLARAQELGIRYTDIRAEIADYTREEVEKACEKMNERGKHIAKYGIKAVLHNHANEMRWIKGEEGITRVYDILISHTDPEYVGFEFDVGWATFAGANALEFVKKYPGRFPLLHVKEVARTAVSSDELEHFPANVLALGMPHPPKHPLAGIGPISKGFSLFSEEQAMLLYNSRSWNCKLGEGIIDWKELIKACEAQGTEAYISEREYYGYPNGNNDPYLCAEHDYMYLRNL